MTYSMTETAEEVARRFNITREDCDAFAVRSHRLALKAIGGGRFKDELVPVTVHGRHGSTIVDTDEGSRPGTAVDTLDGAAAGLAPEIMGMGPVAATRRVLERSGLGAGRLEREAPGGLSLGTMCVGVGQGMSLLVEGL